MVESDGDTLVVGHWCTACGRGASAHPPHDLCTEHDHTGSREHPGFVRAPDGLYWPTCVLDVQLPGHGAYEDEPEDLPQARWPHARALPPGQYPAKGGP